MNKESPESAKITRIPPFSPEETIRYYADGTIPPRFRDIMSSESILQKYGSSGNRIIDDYTRFGGIL